MYELYNSYISRAELYELYNSYMSPQSHRDIAKELCGKALAGKLTMEEFDARWPAAANDDVFLAAVAEDLIEAMVANAFDEPAGSDEYGSVLVDSGLLEVRRIAGCAASVPPRVWRHADRPRTSAEGSDHGAVRSVMRASRPIACSSVRPSR